MPSFAELIRQNANYRFKQRYGRFFAFSMIASVLAHIAFNLYFPDLGEGFQVSRESSLESLPLPPEVIIPPPPKPLAKPSVPMEAPEEIDEDITIEETTPPPPDLIPEAPAEIRDDAQDFLMVAEVRAKPKFFPPQPAMPSYIARARVDVTTLIHFFVDEQGNVDPNRTKINQSSGYPELDEIAVEWAKKIKFHPALNRGEPVKMQMAIPIKWKSK